MALISSGGSRRASGAAGRGRCSSQISWAFDSVVLSLLAKMSFNLVFRNHVGVDRESAEGWCFISGHDFSRAVNRKKVGLQPLYTANTAANPSGHVPIRQWNTGAKAQLFEIEWPD